MLTLAPAVLRSSVVTVKRHLGNVSTLPLQTLFLEFAEKSHPEYPEKYLGFKMAFPVLQAPDVGVVYGTILPYQHASISVRRSKGAWAW